MNHFRLCGLYRNPALNIANRNEAQRAHCSSGCFVCFTLSIQFCYKGADPDTVFRGPMAQDWHELFPSKKDGRRIDTLDLDGISLAAIKGLVLENRALSSQVERSSRRDPVGRAAIRTRSTSSTIPELYAWGS